MRRTRRKSMVTALFLAVSCVLCGCSAAQLEERNFPMLAAVDARLGQVEFAFGFPELGQKDNTDLEEAKVNVPLTDGDSFSESLLSYENSMEREPDCSHLKVLLVGEAFLEEKEALDEMLAYLQKTELFPRNTYVCVVDDIVAFFEIEEELPQDLGTYLETFLQNHESKQELRLINLGKLLDERENRMEAIELPYLTVEDGAVRMDGVFVVDFREN